MSKTWGNFRVLTPRPVSDTILYRCSCEAYHRDLACNHALSMGIQKDGVQIPEERSLQVLGRKKRSQGGRYAKAKPALERQDDDAEDAGTAFACSQALDPCCYNCGQRHSKKPNLIIFCDECDCGFHQKCLVPPLKTVPPEDVKWFCSAECGDRHNRAAIVDDDFGSE